MPEPQPDDPSPPEPEPPANVEPPCPGLQPVPPSLPEPAELPDDPDDCVDPADPDELAEPDEPLELPVPEALPVPGVPPEPVDPDAAVPDPPPAGLAGGVVVIGAGVVAVSTTVAPDPPSVVAPDPPRCGPEPAAACAVSDGASSWDAPAGVRCAGAPMVGGAGWPLPPAPTTPLRRGVAPPGPNRR